MTFLFLLSRLRHFFSGIFSVLMIVCLFSFSGSVFAVDYYWQYQSVLPNFTTAESACNQGISDYFRSFHHLGVLTSNSRTCFYTTKYGDVLSGSNVYLKGDSCPVDQIYNSTDGSCSAPPVDPLIAQCALVAGSTVNYYVTADSNGNVPVNINIAGCEAKMSGVSICRSGADGVGICYGDVTFSGAVSDISTGLPVEGATCEGAACQSDVPIDATSSTPCIPVFDDYGGSSCTSTATVKRPGTSSCSASDTSVACVTTTKPISKDQTQDVTTTQITNSDGSVSKQTTTVTTQTNCSGVNDCKTTTTTSTTAGGTNADGSTKPDSTECTGALCGKPDGLEPEPEEEEEKSAVAGESCDVAIFCEGDAVQCAILRAQKDQRCDSDEYRDLSKAQSQIDEFLSANSEVLNEGQDINVSTLFNDSLNTRFLPSSCPASEVVSLSLMGGKTFEFTYDPLCRLATDLSYLLVIGASIFFVVYIGRSVGGS